MNSGKSSTHDSDEQSDGDKNSMVTTALAQHNKKIPISRHPLNSTTAEGGSESGRPIVYGFNSDKKPPLNSNTLLEKNSRTFTVTQNLSSPWPTSPLRSDRFHDTLNTLPQEPFTTHIIPVFPEDTTINIAQRKRKIPIRRRPLNSTTAEGGSESGRPIVYGLNSDKKPPLNSNTVLEKKSRTFTVTQNLSSPWPTSPLRSDRFRVTLNTLPQEPFTTHIIPVFPEDTTIDTHSLQDDHTSSIDRCYPSFYADLFTKTFNSEDSLLPPVFKKPRTNRVASYECVDCHKLFAQRHNFRIHLAVHQISSSGVVTCEECRTEYSHWRDFRRHYKRVHENIP